MLRSFLHLDLKRKDIQSPSYFHKKSYIQLLPCDSNAVFNKLNVKWEQWKTG